MKINAQIALSLTNTFTKVTLKYDTFEKATFDEYLVASIIKNSKNESTAMTYIDEITGKGSLNSHFKKLYEKESKLKSSQIENILNDSLFPVTLVVQPHFKYYSMFDSSVIKINGVKTLFKGNLRNDVDKLKEILMPKKDDVKFLSIDFDKGDDRLESDDYNAFFSDDGIQVELVDGFYLPISQEEFEKAYKNEDIDISDYPAEIKKETSKGNYKVLTNSEFHSIISAHGYIDSYKNYSILKRDCIKSDEILYLFGMYFYKENIYDFNESNKDRIKEAINVLLSDRAMFNVYHVKSLIHLLDIIDDEFLSQKVVRQFLSRKDSKEISEYAVKLIKGGLEKNWERNILLSIKNFANEADYTCLYKLNNDLNFKIDELIHVDMDVLSEIDMFKVKKYKEDKKNLVDSISLMLGKINTSGIRQRIKKVQKNQAVNKFVKFLNNYQGHNEDDFLKKSYEELVKEHEYVKRIYDNDFPVMLKAVENAENK